MGKLSATGLEQATTVASGTLSATGAGTTTPIFGPCNFFVYGTFVGTVQLERSFDGGTTWVPYTLDAANDYAKFTTPASLVFSEPEHGMLYRVNCIAFTSGTINWRLSSSTDLYATGRGFQ
nr:hypothetical protein [Herbaspirillum sp. ASV7]